jgi:hypothetical protein
MSISLFMSIHQQNQTLDGWYGLTNDMMEMVLSDPDPAKAEGEGEGEDEAEDEAEAEQQVEDAAASDDELWVFNFVLTARNGYPKDQAVLSLVTALLLKNDLQECYFWAHELLESGFDIRPLLWRVYFDFYYATNVALEGLLERKYAENNPLFIVRNLFRAHATPTVFLWRQLTYADMQNVEYQMGRLSFKQLQKCKWLHGVDEKCQPFLLHLKNGDWTQMCYELQFIIQQDWCEQLYTAVLDYYKYNPYVQGVRSEAMQREHVCSRLLFLIARCQSGIDPTEFQNTIFIAPQPAEDAARVYPVTPLVGAFLLTVGEEEQERYACSWRQWLESVFPDAMCSAWPLEDGYKLRF